MWQLMQTSEKFWWMTKKRSSEILRDEWKIFSRASKILVGTGHPTASARHWLRLIVNKTVKSGWLQCLKSVPIPQTYDYMMRWTDYHCLVILLNSRTVLGQWAFSVVGTIFWNSLPLPAINALHAMLSRFCRFVLNWKSYLSIFSHYKPLKNFKA